MQIFVLDKDPFIAASYLCDKHVQKMLVESAQMLYTAHWVLDGKPATPLPAYKKTHTSHPCNLWVRESIENYQWLSRHLLGLAIEYSERYKGKHKTIENGHVLWLASKPPNNIPKIPMTPFVCAFYRKDPKLFEKCFVPDDPVASYRNYYKLDKAKFAKWDKKKNTPSWW